MVGLNIVAQSEGEQKGVGFYQGNIYKCIIYLLQNNNTLLIYALKFMNKNRNNFEHLTVIFI